MGLDEIGQCVVYLMCQYLSGIKTLSVLSITVGGGGGEVKLMESHH